MKGLGAEVDTQELLERYIEIITPEVKSIGTNWEYIYIFSAVFDGNVADFTTGVTPRGESKLGWFSREGRSDLGDLLMKWQRGLSGAGAKGFALIARVDRQNVETRFFYGDDAEEWEVTREWQHFMDKAQELFS
ncbi:Uncharacterised protein [Propionibacterium australiense]|uniref:Uncharacterized protein n=1 Tax=Propionibacterium australiense TaxID=119981 RepID=A0A383S5B4_9ACTN|nr:Hypothetical protein PROPAUS_0954 [Propionibacterium australiense]VEH89003.1 Uncharacterised protein [Propionibacterium australiense]